MCGLIYCRSFTISGTVIPLGSSPGSEEGGGVLEDTRVSIDNQALMDFLTISYSVWLCYSAE